MSQWQSKHLIAGIAVGAGVLGSAVIAPNLYIPNAAHAEQAKVEQPKEVLETADKLSSAFERVAEAIRPSVVSINVVKKVTRQPQRMPNLPEGLRDSPFGDFFRFEPGPSEPREFFQEGQGSGFIVDEEGHILTNNHVVQEADEVQVRLWDDRTFTAKVIGTDPQTDVALLKIDTSGSQLHALPLGDSDSLRVGQWVVAAGTPFGLSSTITAGIVSAKERANLSVYGRDSYQDFIQTDAAINPGNSGGPLLNLQGEVIGINSAIFSRTGGNMGIGFAIPINMARVVMDDLMDDGKVDRGWLGVSIQDLTAGLSRSFNFEGDGVLVGDVVPDSPAAEAGIEAGDIITKLDGKTVTSVQKLRFEVASVTPGNDVEVEVYRDGKRQTFEVEIAPLETSLIASESGTSEGPHFNLGISVRTLTPELANQAGFEEGQRGVIVMQVEPHTAAARAGIRVRDVITQVGETKVDSARTFEKAIENANLAEGVRMIVQTADSRGEFRRFVFLQSRE